MIEWLKGDLISVPGDLISYCRGDIWKELQIDETAPQLKQQLIEWSQTRSVINSRWPGPVVIIASSANDDLEIRGEPGWPMFGSEALAGQ